MYQPAHFREDQLDVQHALIRAHPLGLLISDGPDGFDANPIPFLVDARGDKGMLRCHVARANPQWKALGVKPDCLVVFQGAEHYITPSWYATKKEHGKVVPTWNYATVHCWGRATIRDDAAWVHAQVQALTEQHEQARDIPWAVSDAPDAFIAAQLRGIVGIEIQITRIEGKWKVSQNRPEADREGVHTGLLEEPSADARDMANLVALRGGMAVKP